MAKKVAHDPNEVLAVVDEKDNVVGSATRKEVHEKGLLHREVYVFLVNNAGQVLLQKRKDFPVWDSSASGHFPKDQDYLEAAQREFEEELGILLDKSEFVPMGHFFYDSKTLSNTFNKRFIKVFVVRKDIPVSKIKFDKKEITLIKFFDKHNLSELITSSEKARFFNKLGFNEIIGPPGKVLTAGAEKILKEKFI